MHTVITHLQANEEPKPAAAAKPEPVKQEPVKYATKEAAKEAFKQLLADFEIPPEASWDNAMRLIIHDVRYGALKQMGEKKSAFNEYCTVSQRSGMSCGQEGRPWAHISRHHPRSGECAVVTKQRSVFKTSFSVLRVHRHHRCVVLCCVCITIDNAGVGSSGFVTTCPGGGAGADLLEATQNTCFPDLLAAGAPGCRA